MKPEDKAQNKIYTGSNTIFVIAEWLKRLIMVVLIPLVIVAAYYLGYQVHRRVDFDGVFEPCVMTTDSQECGDANQPCPLFKPTYFMLYGLFDNSLRLTLFLIFLYILLALVYFYYRKQSAVRTAKFILRLAALMMVVLTGVLAVGMSFNPERVALPTIDRQDELVVYQAPDESLAADSLAPGQTPQPPFAEVTTGRDYDLDNLAERITADTPLHIPFSDWLAERFISWDQRMHQLERGYSWEIEDWSARSYWPLRFKTGDGFCDLD